MKKGISTLWAVVVTALVMASAAGGGLYYLHRQNQQEMNKLSEQIELLQDEVAEMKKSGDATSNTLTEEVSETSNTSNSEPTTIASNDPFGLDRLKNGYYRINGSLEQKMVNGSFSYDGSTYTLDEENIAYRHGSDGAVEQAALILKASSGGTAVFKHLILMSRKGDAPAFLAETLLGDRVLINSISIPSRDKIALNITNFGPNDPSCCPSVIEEINYIYTSGTSLKAQ